MNDGQTVIGGEYADVGSSLSKAFSLYTANPIPFLLIFLLTLPITIVTGLWTWGALLAIPGFVIQEIVYGAGTFATNSTLHGSSPNAGKSLSAAVDRLGKLIEYNLRLIGAALLLAITIIGIPWAIRLLVRWFFGTQAIMLHDAEPKAAISESCRLVDGDWWRVFGNFLLVGVIIGMPSFAVRFAVGGTAGLIASALLSTVLAPIFVIFQTLLYLRLLQEKGQAARQMPGLTPGP